MADNIKREEVTEVTESVETEKKEVEDVEEVLGAIIKGKSISSPSIDVLVSTASALTPRRGTMSTQSNT